jgi:O-antigen/teichoic acid export membrane protein
MKLLQGFLKGNQRSVMAKKNVLASMLIKGADTLVYLLLVPLTLGYLNAYEYGIWLTLSSLLSWIDSFDIGLGNGLRNKLAAAMAEEDKEKARSYVSTTFFMLLFITGAIIVVFSFLINIVDWYTVLNVDKSVVGNIGEVILASLLFFCLNFVLKFIGNIYQALQLPAVNYLINFLGHLISLIVIYALTQTTKGYLLWVAIAYSAAPPLVYLLFYPITFTKLYPYLSPSIKYYKREYLKDLLSLSMLFFILQVMGIVLFSLSNLLISNFFGPDQVTPYNIAYRYFSVVPMVFSLLSAPLWSATTDAYIKSDMNWIKHCINRLHKFNLFFLFVITVMVLCSKWIYIIWIGETVAISYTMSTLMGIYTFVIIYSLSYSYFLYGMGKLRLQAINIVVVGILFYPICYYLSILFGVNGILVGMIIVNMSGAVLNTIQLNKVVNHSANGIWSR